jgi:hypothetical protein
MKKSTPFHIFAVIVGSILILSFSALLHIQIWYALIPQAPPLGHDVIKYQYWVGGEHN